MGKITCEDMTRYIEILEVIAMNNHYTSLT